METLKFFYSSESTKVSPEMAKRSTHAKDAFCRNDYSSIKREQLKERFMSRVFICECNYTRIAGTVSSAGIRDTKKTRVQGELREKTVERFASVPLCFFFAFSFTKRTLRNALRERSRKARLHFASRRDASERDETKLL